MDVYRISLGDKRCFRVIGCFLSSRILGNGKVVSDRLIPTSRLHSQDLNEWVLNLK
jgi:hypothetical protein